MLAWHATACLCHNDYVLQFDAPGQTAGTRAPILARENQEVLRLEANFTIMLWLRFDDDSPSRFQPNLQLLQHDVTNFLQPFSTT